MSVRFGAAVGVPVTLGRIKVAEIHLTIVVVAKACHAIDRWPLNRRHQSQIARYVAATEKQGSLRYGGVGWAACKHRE